MFDVIVLGGGIGGLYSAYSVLKKHPGSSVLVLEKASYLGGRVYTYHDKFMTVEAGAGRFHKKHLLLMKLIHKLPTIRHLFPRAWLPSCQRTIWIL
jgi:protoporphyrinogen oxidase